MTKKKPAPTGKTRAKVPTQARASDTPTRLTKQIVRPDEPRPKKPAPRKRSGGHFRLLLGGAIVSGLVTCVAFGLVAFMPASQIDRRPFVIAALITATPTVTSTPTATFTPSLSPTPSNTPTITLTPTVTLTPSITPTETPTDTPTPLPTPDSRDRDFYIPILMYHYISVPPADADIYRKDLSVTPDHFRAQMAWLKENGYETISLYHLVYALNIGWPPLPDKPIILTFDDGYRDNYENGFPILREFGYAGTFFILTDVTDRNDPAYMTWDMLREMSEAGMSIEVHGREHLDMAGRDHDWLVYHLLGAAQTIEANLGYQPRFVAYPAGSFDDLVISTAQELGYWAGISTINGTHQQKDDLFRIQRLRIRGDWELDTFVTIVTES